MFRHPWRRLQSNYYYMKALPQSKVLAPEINETHLLESVNSVLEFAMYPGIANCATKMLNGIPCGADVELNETHLHIAKEVAMSLSFFGVTEHFKSSVCLLSWMYGHDVRAEHFRPARVGNYTRLTLEQALTAEEAERFKQVERFDLDLYEFAKEIFLHRLSLTGIPLLP